MYIKKITRLESENLRTHLWIEDFSFVYRRGAEPKQSGLAGVHTDRDRTDFLLHNEMRVGFGHNFFFSQHEASTNGRMPSKRHLSRRCKYANAHRAVRPRRWHDKGRLR